MTMRRQGPSGGKWRLSTAGSQGGVGGARPPPEPRRPASAPTTHRSSLPPHQRRRVPAVRTQARPALHQPAAPTATRPLSPGRWYCPPGHHPLGDCGRRQTFPNRPKRRNQTDASSASRSIPDTLRALAYLAPSARQPHTGRTRGGRAAPERRALDVRTCRLLRTGGGRERREREEYLTDALPDTFRLSSAHCQALSATLPTQDKRDRFRV